MKLTLINFNGLCFKRWQAPIGVILMAVAHDGGGENDESAQNK